MHASLPRLNKRVVWKIALIAAGGLLGLYCCAVIGLRVVSATVEARANHGLSQTFASEDAALHHPVTLIGLPAPGELQTQCAPTETTRFSNIEYCVVFRTYSSPVDSGADLTIYNRQAPQLVALLKANGWSVDNPTEDAYSPDHLLGVAYHKNIGAISCNLKIGYDPGDPAASKPFINDYSCQKSIKVPALNRQTRLYGG